jgi:hypothetical protein
MNMGMSKSGAETAEELKLSSLKHALHPSVLEEAMPRIAGPERLAETLTSRRHISLSRCRRLALSFSVVPEAQRGSGFSLCRPPEAPPWGCVTVDWPHPRFAKDGALSVEEGSDDGAKLRGSDRRGKQ